MIVGSIRGQNPPYTRFLSKYFYQRIVPSLLVEIFQHPAVLIIVPTNLLSMFDVLRYPYFSLNESWPAKKLYVTALISQCQKQLDGGGKCLIASYENVKWYETLMQLICLLGTVRGPSFLSVLLPLFLVHYCALLLQSSMDCSSRCR